MDATQGSAWGGRHNADKHGATRSDQKDLPGFRGEPDYNREDTGDEINQNLFNQQNNLDLKIVRIFLWHHGKINQWRNHQRSRLR